MFDFSKLKKKGKQDKVPDKKGKKKGLDLGPSTKIKAKMGME